MSKIPALSLAALIALGSTSAHAQWGYNTQQFGNQTYYNGYDANGGAWIGNAQQFGNQSYSHFYGPSGQMTNCTQQRFGNQVYTNCY